jgi:UDP-N-acetylglucosamine/UDP-N-acetylgalactosamine diphosphorylase
MSAEGLHIDEDTWASQKHIIEFYQRAKAEGKHQFLQSQITQFDPIEISQLHEKTKTLPSLVDIKIEPFTNISRVTNDSQRSEWETVGLQQIRLGKVAAVLLAGGQGTRLGSSKPKGLTDFGFPSHKTLFQIQAERIRNLISRSGGSSLPWYIMTSEYTDKETEDFFKDHSHFGLNPKDILYFQQPNLPALDENGKILLSNPYQV